MNKRPYIESPREALWQRITYLQGMIWNGNIQHDTELRECLLVWSEQELKRPLLPLENIYL